MTPRVGEVIDGYRFLGGDPSQQSSWEDAAKPAVGTTIDGYTFKGGDPNSESSWEKAQPKKGLVDRAAEAVKPKAAPESETAPAARAEASPPEITDAQEAASAGTDYWTGGTPKPKTGSVTDNIPSAPPSGAPVRPEVRAAIEYKLATATPQERAVMQASPDWRGQVARAQAPGVEARKKMLKDSALKQGAKAEDAERYAARNAVTPDAADAKATDFEFETGAAMKEKSALERGTYKAFRSLSQSGGGIVAAALELAGADASEIREVADKARRDVEAVGEGKEGRTAIAKAFEGVVHSIVSQAPGMVQALATGGALAPLIYIGAQSAGQEYIEGRSKGLSPDAAMARAAAFGAAEVLGERFALPNFASAFKKAFAGVPVEQLMPELAKYIAKEVPGEMVTTILQFGTDLNSKVGLNQNATLEDLTSQLKDTVVQTVMQVGITSGSAMGARKLASMAPAAAPSRVAAGLIDQAVAGATINPQGVEAAAVEAMRDPSRAPVVDAGLASARPSAYRETSGTEVFGESVAALSAASSVDEAITAATSAVGAVLNQPSASEPKSPFGVPPEQPQVSLASGGFTGERGQPRTELPALQPPGEGQPTGIIDSAQQAAPTQAGGVVSGVSQDQLRADAAAKRGTGELMSASEIELARQFDAKPAPAIANPDDPTDPPAPPPNAPAAQPQPRIVDARGEVISVGGRETKVADMSDGELAHAGNLTRSSTTKQIIVAEQMRRREPQPAQQAPAGLLSYTPGPSGETIVASPTGAAQPATQARETQLARTDTQEGSKRLRVPSAVSGFGRQEPLASARPVNAEPEWDDIDPDTLSEPKITGAGKVFGAPSGMSSEGARSALVRKVVSEASKPMAVSEKSKDWYEDSGREIARLARGDRALIERTTRLMALYSQGNSAEGNTTATIKSLVQLARGQTPEAGRYPNMTKPVADAVLAAEKMSVKIPGVNHKVLSFYRNLIDPALGENNYPDAVTIDRWMMRKLGYKFAESGETGGASNLSASQYAYARDVMLRATKAYNQKHGTNLHPRQLQSMLWTLAKNEGKKAGLDNTRSALKQEIATYKEMKAKGNQLAGEEARRSQEKLDELPKTIQPKSESFSHHFRRMTALLTWETVPSTRSGILPGISRATPEQLAEFTKAAHAVLLDEQGNNALFEKVSLVPLYSESYSKGTFEKAINPNILSGLVLEGGMGKPDAETANLVADLLGYIYSQDAVPWHMPDPGVSKKDGRTLGVEVKWSDGIDDADFYAHVGAKIPGAEYTKMADGSYRFLNFTGLQDSEFQSNLMGALASFETTADYDAQAFFARTAYREGGKNGKGYLQRVREAGRSDLLRWARGRREALSAVYEDFGARYGWSGRQPQAGDGEAAGEAEGLTPRASAKKTPPSGGVSASRAQTSTPEFKRWFGDSKVVDENGEPLVVYHGTHIADGFDAFDTSREGAHFGSVMQAASRIGASREIVRDAVRRGGPADYQTGRHMIPVYLSIQNPLRMDDIGDWGRFQVVISALKRSRVITEEEMRALEKAWENDDEWGALKSALAAKGYDGIVYHNRIEARGKGGDSYIAFHPEQIKSAVGNSGAFDPQNPDILASTADRPVSPAKHIEIKAAITRAVEAAGGTGTTWPDGTRMRVVSHPDEIKDSYLRSWVSENGDDMIEGFYDPESKEIYIISSNLDSVDRALFVATAHEVFHAGLRKAIGAEAVDPVMRAIYARNKRVRDAAARLVAQGLSIPVATEEVLADMPDRGDLKGWDKLLALIKNFLAKLGVVKWTDEQVEMLVSASRASVRAPDGPVSVTVERQTETPAFRKWFGDSKAVGEDGRPIAFYHSTTGDFNSFSEWGTLGNHFGTLQAAHERSVDYGKRMRDFGIPNSENDPLFVADENGIAPAGANTMPVYLSVQKPLAVVDVGNWMDSTAVLDGILTGRLPRALRSTLQELRDEIGQEREDGLYDDFADFDWDSEDGRPAPDWAGAWTLSPENERALADIRSALEMAGYDSISYENSVEDRGSTSYLVFRSSQIKSAIGNNGNFDPASGDITKSEKAPVFYSELARQIAATKNEVMPAQQWKAWLQNQQGIKKDELQWSGVLDWLDLIESQRPSSRRHEIAVSSLPEDMQDLLLSIAEDAGVSLPGSVPVSTAPISAFPEVSIGRNKGDARGEKYVADLAKAFDDLPPPVVIGGRLVDGRHRVAAARLVGAKQLRYIDLSEAIKRAPAVPNIGPMKFGGITAKGVSRQDILDYLANSGVEVRDVMLGEAEPPAGWSPVYQSGDEWVFEGRGIRGVGDTAQEAIIDAKMQMEREAHRSQKGGREERARLVFANADELDPYIEALAGKAPGGGAAKFQSYTLPGGTNYREVLLTLPEKEAPQPKITKRRDGLFNVILPDGRRFDGRTRGMADDLARGFMSTSGPTGADKVNFHSQHFNEPNIVAHLRVNERTDSDGRKILFIEEIQSDWAQKGKRDGFSTAEAKRKQAEITAKMDTLAKDRDPITNKMRDEAGWMALANERDQYDIAISRGIPAAPFVTKTEAWVSLAVKRAIRMAVDGGYDGIAWTTGEQQADRYDLSKQVDEIRYQKVGGGKFDVHVFPLGESDSITRTLSESELPDFVGKEIAEKIVSGAGRKFNTQGVMSLGGENRIDLKVGGEGMKTFYDSIVPNVVKDVLKKLGGGRLAQLSIPIAGAIARQGRPASAAIADFLREDENAKQPGFYLTPDMKAKAQQGLPMFSQRRSGESKPESDEDADLDFTPRAGLGDVVGQMGKANKAMKKKRVDEFASSRGMGRQLKLLEALARNTDTFQFDDSAKSDWEGIAKDMGLKSITGIRDGHDPVRGKTKVIELGTKMGRRAVRDPDGSEKIDDDGNVVMETGPVPMNVVAYFGQDIFAEGSRPQKTVWVDSSTLQTGRGGKEAYQLVYTWAARNGHVMIPDPNGVSPVATEARIGSMLSAAMRLGTTKFMWPVERPDISAFYGWQHPKWLEKMDGEWKWVDDPGSEADQHNKRLLIEAAIGIVEHKLAYGNDFEKDPKKKFRDPETGRLVKLEDLEYNLQYDEIVWRDTNEPVSERTLAGILEQILPVGVRTLRRSAEGGRPGDESRSEGAGKPDMDQAKRALGEGPRATLVRALLFRSLSELSPQDVSRYAAEFAGGKRAVAGTPLEGILASRRPDWIESGSADLKSAASKIDTFAPQKTFADKVKALKPVWKQWAVQKIFDAYAPLQKLGHREYVLARMARSGGSSLEAMLLYGKPRLGADGAIHGDLDGKGFLGHMADLKGEHDRFFMWVAGRRAQRLAGEGRENLFAPGEIADMAKLDGGQMKDGSSRKQAYANALLALSAYNKSVLDIAEATGLIDGEARSNWEHDFYVPFFRVDEDMKLEGPSKVKGLVRQKAFEKLKGGTENLGDLLDNTMRNWSHLIDASLANQAAVASMKKAEQLGIATRTAAGEKGATYVMQGGKQVWYEVSDPFVLDAVSALEAASFNHPLMKVMGKFKHYLTLGVTVSPTFRVRNLIRDSISAIGQNDLSYNAAKNVWQGFAAMDRSKKEYQEALFNGAVIRFGQLTDGKHAEHAKRLILDGVDDATILDTPAKVRAALGRAWDFWQETGDKAENVNRMSRYRQGLARGESALEAAFASRDMMDFSLQGSSQAVRFLSQLVPFMNARLQGMYKLGRSAKQDPARFATVAGAVALLSVGLLFAYKDDEEWKKREDWDRDNFWWIKLGDTAVRIPKPFELGSIGTIAERSVEAMISDEMTGERFYERMKSLLGDTLALNPVPQLFKPAIDLYANKDSFSGRQIESRGMEKLSKPERYGPNTTLVAKTLGKAGNATGLSPVQVDHLIRSYFGWLGSHIAMIPDLIAQPFDDKERPARKVGDAFVVGDFVKDLPAGRSRYIEEFYKQAKAIDEVMGDIRRAREAGEAAKIEAILKDKGDEVALSRFYDAIDRKISEVNRRARIIRESNFSAEVKRQRLDELDAVRNKLAEQAARAKAARRAATRGEALPQ